MTVLRMTALTRDCCSVPIGIFVQGVDGEVRQSMLIRLEEFVESKQPLAIVIRKIVEVEFEESV